MPGSFHTHCSTDCECSFVPLFSTEFTCQEGYVQVKRLGPELLLTPPAARAKPCSECHLPASSQTSRLFCLSPANPQLLSTPVPSNACSFRSPICPYDSLQLGGKLRCIFPSLAHSEKASCLHCSAPSHFVLWVLGLDKRSEEPGGSPGLSAHP